jgi:hypothetical protein
MDCGFLQSAIICCGATAAKEAAGIALMDMIKAFKNIWSV